MKQFNFLSIAFILLTSTASYADYFAGGSINYTALGNNQYLVTVNVIRDCAASPAPGALTLTVSSFTCNVSQIATLLVSSSNPLTGFCPHLPSTCNGGTTPGFQEWIYTCVVTLPSQCADWIFSTGSCCRVSTFSSMQANQNFYLEAALNNIGQDNNSVQQSNSDLSIVCMGQASFYNFGSIDVDGDSLSYSIMDALESANSNVVYNPGYSGLNPVHSSPPISINPATGDIQMQITMIEYSVIAVKIEEYRNGNLIGFTTRNVAVYSDSCNSSNPPSIYSVSQIINIEATEQFCTDFITSDPDANDTLTLTCNNLQIPGSTCSVTGTPFPIAHFCWTPTVNDTSSTPYTLVLSVRDQDCPTNNVVTNAIVFYVGPYTYISGINNNKLKLSPNPASDNFSINSDGVIPKFVSIYNIFGQSYKLGATKSGYDISILPAGIYIVNVQMDNGSVLKGQLVKN